MLLGFILGPMMEEYLRRAFLLAYGDPMVFVTRPISATMLGLAVITHGHRAAAGNPQEARRCIASRSVIGVGNRRNERQSFSRILARQRGVCLPGLDSPVLLQHCAAVETGGEPIRKAV